MNCCLLHFWKYLHKWDDIGGALDPLISQIKMEPSVTVQNNTVKIKYIILKYLNNGV